MFTFCIATRPPSLPQYDVGYNYDISELHAVMLDKHLVLYTIHDFVNEPRNFIRRNSARKGSQSCFLDRLSIAIPSDMTSDRFPVSFMKWGIVFDFWRFCYMMCRYYTHWFDGSNVTDYPYCYIVLPDITEVQYLPPFWAKNKKVFLNNYLTVMCDR